MTFLNPSRRLHKKSLLNKEQASFFKQKQLLKHRSISYDLRFLEGVD